MTSPKIGLGWMGHLLESIERCWNDESELDAIAMVSAITNQIHKFELSKVFVQWADTLQATSVHDGKHEIHPVAYLLKETALGKTHGFWSLESDSIAAKNKEYDKIRNMMKSPDINYAAWNILYRRAGTILSGFTKRVKSSIVHFDLLLLNCQINAELFHARVILARGGNNVASRSPGEPGNYWGTHYRMIAAHGKNLRVSQRVRERLPDTDQATRATVRYNFVTCAACQAMYGRTFLSLFGVAGDDSFLCFACGAASPPTLRAMGTSHAPGTTKASGSKKRKRRRKKKAGNTAAGPGLAIATDSIGTIQDRLPRNDHSASPTSVALFPSQQPPLESLSPSLLETTTTALEKNPPGEDPSKPCDRDTSSWEDSNDDLVNHLIQFRSILALNDYMDELGLDCPDTRSPERRGS